MTPLECLPGKFSAPKPVEEPTYLSERSVVAAVATLIGEQQLHTEVVDFPLLMCPFEMERTLVAVLFYVRNSNTGCTASIQETTTELGAEKKVKILQLIFPKKSAIGEQAA